MLCMQDFSIMNGFRITQGDNELQSTHQEYIRHWVQSEVKIEVWKNPAHFEICPNYDLITARFKINLHKKTSA